MAKRCGTIINKKTYLTIGSSPLFPYQGNVSGIEVHVLNEDTFLPDVIIVLDFLRPTQFTFDENGIRLCREIEDDPLVNIFSVCDETPSVVNVSHIVNNENCEETKDSKSFKFKEAKKLEEN
ncbi:hypothetical protein TNIN_387491 [Trichonephila inaurata madagascariensis]|uniref:Uncharacterized protein n=1 Tax=Trichonephila inaurata madagascariensis TaxID=2747483 RepID=A0A8X7C1D9_9ARAC|nr:hypothetical protein TNIN_387491 [Trichonephila inaurata madagascariensis]